MIGIHAFTKVKNYDKIETADHDTPLPGVCQPFAG